MQAVRSLLQIFFVDPYSRTKFVLCQKNFHDKSVNALVRKLAYLHSNKRTCHSKNWQFPIQLIKAIGLHFGLQNVQRY